MAQTQLKRHPVRGALWGLILGLGVLVALTFVWPVIGLDDIKTVAVKGGLVVGGIMLLSILWAYSDRRRSPRARPRPSPMPPLRRRSKPPRRQPSSTTLPHPRPRGE